MDPAIVAYLTKRRPGELPPEMGGDSSAQDPTQPDPSLAQPAPGYDPKALAAAQRQSNQLYAQDRASQRVDSAVQQLSGHGFRAATPADPDRAVKQYVEQRAQARAEQEAAAKAAIQPYLMRKYAAGAAEDEAKASELDAARIARETPAYAEAMSGALSGWGLKVPEGTPPQAMEKLLGPAERLAQARVAGQWRSALQNKIQRKRDYDSNTGTYRTTYFRPLDGATWDANFNLISPGVPGMGLSQSLTGQEQIEDAGGAAPTGAPAPGGQPAPAAPPRVAVPSAPQAAPGGGGARFPPMIGKVLDKASQAFGSDLDPNKGTGEIQKNQARLNAAIRLRKLVTDENGNIKTMIPPQFMKETAMALAQLVSAGGQPAQGLVEELTPRTGSSKLADILQWITNNPQDAGQQGFVKLYLESANREATAAQEALNKAVRSRVGKHQRFIRGNPDEARTVAQAFGWNLDPEKMTLTPIESAEVASGAVEPKATGAKVKMVDPKGKIWSVPASKVDEAKSHGWKEG